MVSHGSNDNHANVQDVKLGISLYITDGLTGSFTGRLHVVVVSTAFCNSV